MGTMGGGEEPIKSRGVSHVIYMWEIALPI